MALSLAQDGNAQVKRNVNDAVTASLLVALGTAQDCDTNIQGDGDQRRATTLVGLVAFDVAESGDTQVERHTDQTVGDCLSLTSHISENASTEVNRNTKETTGVSSGDCLSLVS